MAGSGISRRDANKQIRQEALREQLAKQKHVEHVIDLLGKIEDLQGAEELDSLKIQRLKIAIDTRLKLVGKYLPDVKSVEMDITGNMDHRFVVQAEPDQEDADAWLSKHKPK